MKKTNLKIQLAIISLCAILFSSCGINKNNDFSSRKYTHFKKGETEIAIKSVKTKKNNIELKDDVVKPIEIADISASNCNQDIVNKPVSIIDHKTNKTVAGKLYASLISPKVNSKKVKQTSELIRSFIKAKSNTTSTLSANDDQLLLVIIAILLPPLAVFLVRGFGNEFWIDILLCLLLWLPGIIYAVIVVLGAA